jgi:hypothetical protein
MSDVEIVGGTATGWVKTGTGGWVEEIDLLERWSRASADYECVHGRLPGDPCPQPAEVPGGDIQKIGPKPVPNLHRRWDQPYPCDCWGEARVVGTPNPFQPSDVSTVRNGRSRVSATPPGSVPRPHTEEVENGKEPVAGRARSRRGLAGVVGTDWY